MSEEAGRPKPEERAFDAVTRAHIFNAGSYHTHDECRRKCSRELAITGTLYAPPHNCSHGDQRRYRGRARERGSRARACRCTARGRPTRRAPPERGGGVPARGPCCGLALEVGARQRGANTELWRAGARAENRQGAQILKQAPVAGRQPRMHKASRHGGRPMRVAAPLALPRSLAGLRWIGSLNHVYCEAPSGAGRRMDLSMPSPSPRPPLRAAGRGHHMYKRRPRAERRWGRRTAGPSARGPGEAPRPLSAGEGAPRRAAPPAWWHRIGRRGGKRS
ncbi:unnamed protein product [Prorocentrum cordatum]|uniref:Uncharacterized protein n=1 Tax=Prorocentrum cordatum TaxID=2364126 RepID=A0ABN9U8G6_9DINO|nr:unnamed protein product [Polarella glacialis]